MSDIGNEITLYDEDGKELIFNILFTYENEDRGAEYVLFYDPLNPDDILVARYSEDGDNYIFDLELSDEEYAEADEVLGAYEEDPLIQENLDD